jgi:hypothetical protein
MFESCRAHSRGKCCALPRSRPGQAQGSFLRSCVLSSATKPRCRPGVIVWSVVLLYPLVLGAALWLALRRVDGQQHGWDWFLGWAVAGALFTFSFLTGFSIGLFLLPVAALVLFWVARRSGGRETVGLLEGVGWTLLTVAFIQSGSGDLDARPWLVAGLVLSLGAAGTYAGLQR